MKNKLKTLLDSSTRAWRAFEIAKDYELDVRDVRQYLQELVNEGAIEVVGNQYASCKMKREIEDLKRKLNQKVEHTEPKTIGLPKQSKPPKEPKPKVVKERKPKPPKEPKLPKEPKQWKSKLIANRSQKIYGETDDFKVKFFAREQLIGLDGITVWGNIVSATLLRNLIVAKGGNLVINKNELMALVSCVKFEPTNRTERGSQLFNLNCVAYNVESEQIYVQCNVGMNSPSGHRIHLPRDELNRLIVRLHQISKGKFI